MSPVVAGLCHRPGVTALNATYVTVGTVVHSPLAIGGAAALLVVAELHRRVSRRTPAP